MTDEPARFSHAQPDNGRGSNNRSFFGLFGVLAVIVIVVLILLMLNSCEAASGPDSGDSSGRKIMPVNGLVASPGVISVWVAEGRDINTVISISGLQESAVTSMGGGRYVVTVPAGSEETLIKILADNENVYDAGRVYAAPSN